MASWHQKIINNQMAMCKRKCSRNEENEMKILIMKNNEKNNENEIICQ
jgi:hypothetical protein